MLFSEKLENAAKVAVQSVSVIMGKVFLPMLQTQYLVWYWQQVQVDQLQVADWLTERVAALCQAELRRLQVDDGIHHYVYEGECAELLAHALRNEMLTKAEVAIIVEHLIPLESLEDFLRYAPTIWGDLVAAVTPSSSVHGYRDEHVHSDG